MEKLRFKVSGANCPAIKGANRPRGELSVGRVSVGESSVGESSGGESSVGESSGGELSGHH